MASLIHHRASAGIGKVRRESLNGREHVVAPVTLIVEGVLDGSNGPLYYPSDELAASPSDWNGIPILLEHPKSGDTGRAPATFDKQGLGTLYNARYENHELLAEGWFDLDLVRNRRPQLLAQIETGRPIELSTGLFAESEETTGTFNGRPYQAIARDYRPDHLAILPESQGACSVQDGCGVNNASGILNRIRQLLGMHKEPDMSASSSLVDSLIANCDCWSDSDRKLLSSLNSKQLERMANAMSKSDDDEEKQENEGKGDEGEPQENEGDKCRMANVSDEDLEKEWNRRKARRNQDADEDDEKGQKNRKREPAKNAAFDEQSWFSQAPPSVRSVVQNAIRFERQQRQQLIDGILENEANRLDKNFLQDLSIQNLTAIAESLSPHREQDQAVVPLFNFAEVAPTASRSTRDEPLALPTIDWSEKA